LQAVIINKVKNLFICALGLWLTLVAASSAYSKYKLIICGDLLQGKGDFDDFHKITLIPPLQKDGTKISTDSLDIGYSTEMFSN
jgi:hypothetical protein